MRVSWQVGIAIVGLGWWVPCPASAQQELLERLLKLTPSQSGIDYETPTEPAVLAACKVETQTSPDGGQVAAYIIRDGQGKLLRKFVDLDGALDARKSPTLDQFSYFQDGFEVYRETDLDGDRKIDECRWMNFGGTRVLAIVNQGDKVRYAWKRLSAEEATKVMVQALVSGDLALLDSVMATPEEFSAMNLPQAVVDQASAAAKDRIKLVTELRSKLKGWGKTTTWSRFDGMMPHALPSELASGLRDDLLLYENGVIFAGQPGGQGDPLKMAYLQVPELIRLGDTWKFVGLPIAVDPAKPVVPSNYEGIRSALFRGAGADVLAGRDPALAEAEKKLADYDAANLPGINPGDPKTILKFHYGRLTPLRAILKIATRPEDQLLYNKQVVDDLATCYQTGLFPDGSKLLDDMIQVGGKVASYAAFRKILAEYAMEDSPANPLAHQKAYMEKLEDFLKEHAKSDEAPDALLQLASNHEFNAEEDEAQRYYEQLARDFPETQAGKKAAGALRRLDLVGKTLTLKGSGLKGEAIDIAQYRGKTVVVLFWHSGYEPVRRELPELLKVVDKHKDKGLMVVGVNLDGGDQPPLEAFLKSNLLPWPQIVEPGGMDGRLADEFGIISLPTMFLVDTQGKVTQRGLRTALEVDRLMEKSVAARPDPSLGIK
jgi:thiol-disulfide isomerase/thioredoxin